MQNLAHYLSIFLGVGAIALQALSLLTILFLVFSPKGNKFLFFLKKDFLLLGFLVSLATVLSSLLYSEIFRFTPCYHCWIQRIFMFPQVFLFGVAYFRKDCNVIFYSLPLLLFGLLDALYLNYIYYFNPSTAPCDASGISCAQRLVSEFGGYISIPSLSLTAFIALLTLLLVAYSYRKRDPV